MKKYRIEVRYINPKRPTDKLNFVNYNKFNARYDELVAYVEGKREGIMEVSRFVGKELIETVHVKA